jgi:hypothetical protein
MKIIRHTLNDLIQLIPAESNKISSGPSMFHLRENKRDYQPKQTYSMYCTFEQCKAPITSQTYHNHHLKSSEHVSEPIENTYVK